MQWSQIIGLGGLVLLAVLGFWLMNGGKKLKPRGEDQGRGPGEGTHGVSSEAFRHSGESQPGGD